MSRRKRLFVLVAGAGGVAWYVRSRKEPTPSPFRADPPRSFTTTPPAPAPFFSEATVAEEPVAETLADEVPVAEVPLAQEHVASSWPGSAVPLADGGSPGAAFVIKGNRDSMIYHTEDSPAFGRTVAEVWFDTEEHAVAAGFRPPKARGASDDTMAFAAPLFEPGPYPGSALPLADGGSPAPSYVVKGNEDSMLYHEPDGRSYDATYAEVWFETAADAEAAGFARPGSE